MRFTDSLAKVRHAQDPDDSELSQAKRGHRVGDDNMYLASLNRQRILVAIPRLEVCDGLVSSLPNQCYPRNKSYMLRNFRFSPTIGRML